jgi:2-polyprenyl-6-methoxyphenol hydroxylase-like FAD-dependent oxidoreductase
MSETEVLIVGAGPTGLNLALRLAHYGIAFRLIDKASGHGQASRAMAVHARTLEFYRQLGFAEEVIAEGIEMPAMHLRQAGQDADLAVLPFGTIGADLSPYPFVLTYPQDDHERLLGRKLTEAGITIEWNTTLADFTANDLGVKARLVKDGAEEQIKAAYICGCDGAHSAVREGLQLDFPGGTYPNRFYVADAKIAGDFTTEGAITFGEDTFALKMPVRSRETQRLIGLVPPALAERTDLTFEDLRPTVESLLAVKVETVNWFSAYLSHHRVAGRFRIDRCFVAGDAGHVHSPAGGQGMNTGIGDAINLAWKLAAVLRGRASEAILDTYESERIAFARKLVSTTDSAFRIPIQGGAQGRLLRGGILPRLLPALLKLDWFRRLVFRTISQTAITYRDTSTLSEGKAGHLRGGDRLPWIAGMGADNFAPLASLDWQIHVYGHATEGLKRAADDLALPLHRFNWGQGANRAGIPRDSAFLIRPDGYIGAALVQQSAAQLRAYVQRHGLACLKH